MKKSSGEQVKSLQTEEQSVEGRSRDRKINKGGKSQVDRMRSWATSCECVYVCIYLSRGTRQSDSQSDIDRSCMSVCGYVCGQ